MVDPPLTGSPPLSPQALAARPAVDRYAALASSDGGLSSSEAERRAGIAGRNELPAAATRSATLAFLENFTHALALLLWFAAGLSFAAGVPELGLAIVAVVAVNGVFAFIQERRAEQVVAGLMRRVAVRARVVRDGMVHVVPAADLVPGDVVLLAGGDVAPADCILAAGAGLMLDQAILTGESIAVARTADVDSSSARDFELACFVPSGAAIVSGEATALVSATGAASSLGRVAHLVQGVARGDSILEKQVEQLSRVTVAVATIAGALTLVLAGIATETDFLAALTFGTGVIVALVPEGLLPTLTVSLAIGARRMGAKGAAVRRLAAVEVIGSVTVICTDKTGTLTRNAAEVAGFLPAADTNLEEARIAAALCNDAHRTETGLVGDPIDVAAAAWGTSDGRSLEMIRQTYPRLDAIPFDARRRYSAVTVTSDGRRWVIAKGAPEAIQSLAGGEPLGESLRDGLEAASRAGERVVALAAGPDLSALRVLGVLRLVDPPRPEVPLALAACRAAGVRVIMLTGDHPETARALARSVGLDHGAAAVVSGTDLDGMSEVELVGALSGNAVVARVSPEQKLRIVQALRAAGEIVVVTGDGVNDAPALRAADVGVAMGMRGTEVAKQAADIVLADDNFATIVAAIDEGRAIRRNIRRFVSYVFTSNVAELVPFVCYIFLPIPLPLAVIQVLAIDLGTDLLPALALGVEPPSESSMRQPPEPPRRPLMTRALAVRTFLFFGLLEAVLGMAAYLGRYVVDGWRPFDGIGGYPDLATVAPTATFLGIVSGQIGCLFAQRDGPLWSRLRMRGNAWLAAGLAVEVLLAVVLLYVPGLSDAFSMSPLSPLWLLVLPVGAAVFLAIDLVRRATSRGA